MKKNIYILLTFLIMLPLGMHAQKEMNWWYFGSKAGLNFNETQTVNSSTAVPMPTILPKAVVGPIATLEGTFSLSDKNGNLLMSSDGMTVYNRKNQVMTNGEGLRGGRSSTQSGIVIPAPKNPNKFYIVTVMEEFKLPGGIAYSVVNLNVNDPNDMGSVEAATKNTILKDGRSYENIAAVPHSNGSDFWLVHRSENMYYVWLLTDQGFSTTPKTYEIPPTKNEISYQFLGETITSPDNTKLVSFAYSYDIISSNFDPTTGVISDTRVHNTGASRTYGGSFSPNGEYLYIGILMGTTAGTGRRYKWSELRAGDPNLKATALSAQFSIVRLGSDGRLYGTYPHYRHLYVIMNPDEGGTDIRPFHDYLKGTAVYGLPNFMQSFYVKAGKIKPFSCSGYEAKLAITLSMSGVNIPTRLVWDFGDGVLKEQSFITGKYDYEMNHLFATSGLKKITVTPYNGFNALAPSSFDMNIIDCDIKTNRMIRQDLLNIDQLEINK